MLLDQKMDDLVLQHLQINAPAAHMEEWDALVNRVKNLNQELNIALVGNMFNYLMLIYQLMKL